MFNGILAVWQKLTKKLIITGNRYLSKYSGPNTETKFFFGCCWDCFCCCCCCVWFSLAPIFSMENEEKWPKILIFSNDPKKVVWKYILFFCGGSKCCR